MDFGDTESERSSSSVFNVMHIRESGLSQDTQYRSRKSPRKRLKAARTSASLVIDQLKSVFRCPGDLASRVRTRRNWRPEFLTRYFRDSRCDCARGAILRHDKRNLIPEAPKICSIGLRFGTGNLGDSDDLSNSCDAIRNFKKRFVRRPTIVCKYWVTQSTSTSSLSTDVSLKAHTNRQMIIDCTSTEIISKYNRAQKSNPNSHHSQLYEHIEEKGRAISDTLRNDRAVDHRSSGDFKDPFVRKDQYDGSRMRDAQIQTSDRKSSRRKMKRRPKPATAKEISHRERPDNEFRTAADFSSVARSRNSRNRRDEPWPRARVLENRRTEYINKFTAVNRQIEEITATLRETCGDDGSSRSNPENCDEYFSSISDDAKPNTNWSDVEGSVVARGDASREGDGLANVERIVAESKSGRRENVREILHVDDNEAVLSPEKTVASTRNPEEIPNAFGHDSVRAMKETAYPSNRISRKETRAKCRFVKQMSFDLDLARDQNDEECSIGDELYDKVYPRNNFAISNNERDLAESLANLEELRYCKIIEEKIGEVAVLEDIKRRIDRDFDERSENDTEDFLTVSQKSSNLDHRNVIDVASTTTIEEFRSTPLIDVSTSPEPTETEVHNSLSVGGMSEHSNENSALSKYFSCTQIPSLISLSRSEDETIDLSIITHDSSLPSNYDYESHLSPNNCSFSHLDSSFDRSYFTLEYVALSPDKFLNFGTANKSHDAISEVQESFAENKICERECSLLGEEDGREQPAKKGRTADFTLETSKSSRYVGSIDSGVFSSSLIDVHPAESPFDVGRTKFKKKHRPEKFDGPSAAVDSGSDSSCTDDTLDRKVNDVVRDLTRNLILCERRARMKLKARDACYTRHILSRACKFSGNLRDSTCDFFHSSGRSSEDERIVSISTPSLLSLSDSDIEDYEARCQRVSR